MQQRKQDRGGERVESIAPFRPVREGEPQAARRLRYTPQIRNWWAWISSLLGVYRRGTDPEKLDRFAAASPRDHVLSSVKQGFDKGRSWKHLASR
ncbi:hypothetical protein [Arthrobacter sp. PAMC 25486]|uniref:hypothetical protein n=1 Tax=Arthrobacter sp. PAMC 25486 TaxID=1494608 RepID=UPI00056F3A49|nr:hypothetical protein [Arthrobacter sp. PAMC 25486]